MTLVAEGLAVRFRDAEGLAFEALNVERVSFEPGRITAVTGPSGSGKTTLLFTLAGLIAPSKGRVIWKDQSISAWPESRRDAWRRHTAGLIFQDFALIAELSPLANVLLPASFGRVPNGFSPKQRAAALFESLGVPQSRRRISDLSRGEQQRVAIARALLFDPPILFADEPTASLDRDNAQTVISLLGQAAKAGKTVVAVSHDDLLLGEAAVTHRLDRGRLTGESA